MGPMPYRVMALKLRPEKFQDVIAQDHIIKTLQNAIRLERVAHAYLFSGPRGTGKTTTARLLAKALNCKNGPTPCPCGKCIFCKGIAGGKNMDVLEIDGASNRGIDEIRQLREEVGFAASKGKRRIYIIDEVHMLTPEAFNALLKTLEQPPSHVVFIFATTEPTQVPETILSRCQRYNFRRIPSRVILTQLQKIVSREGLDATDEALILIARKADGAMRDALSMLDQVVSFSSGEEVTCESVRDLLGIIPRDFYFDLTQAILEKNSVAALNVVARLVEEGGDFGDFTLGLLEHFRYLLVFSVEEGSKEELPEVEKMRFRDLADKFQEDDLLRMLNMVSELELQIGRVSEPRFWLELTLMKLVKATSTIEMEALMARLDGLEEVLRYGRANKPKLSIESLQTSVSESLEKKEEISDVRQLQENLPNQLEKGKEVAEFSSSDSEAVSMKCEVTLETVRTSWDLLVQEVKAKKISVGTFLAEGRPNGLEDQELRVVFLRNREFHANQVRRNREMIEAAAAKLFGVRLRIGCEVDYGLDSEEEREDKGQVELDDRVKMALQVFDGKIVE